MTVHDPDDELAAAMASGAILPRPIPNCPHVDEIDGTCSHPDALTPECWVLMSRERSDCPPLDDFPTESTPT